MAALAHWICGSDVLLGAAQAPRQHHGLASAQPPASPASLLAGAVQLPDRRPNSPTINNFSADAEPLQWVGGSLGYLSCDSAPPGSCYAVTGGWLLPSLFKPVPSQSQANPSLPLPRPIQSAVFLTGCPPTCGRSSNGAPPSPSSPPSRARLLRLELGRHAQQHLQLLRKQAARSGRLAQRVERVDQVAARERGGVWSAPYSRHRHVQRLLVQLLGLHGMERHVRACVRACLCLGGVPAGGGRGGRGGASWVSWLGVCVAKLGALQLHSGRCKRTCRQLLKWPLQLLTPCSSTALIPTHEANDQPPSQPRRPHLLVPLQALEHGAHVVGQLHKQRVLVARLCSVQRLLRARKQEDRGAAVVSTALRSVSAACRRLCGAAGMHGRAAQPWQLRTLQS